MSKLFKRIFGGGGGSTPVTEQSTVSGGGSVSQRYTGVGHRVNPATGDLGPDAPRGGHGGGGDTEPRNRRRGGPSSRRNLGGVRSPLS